jgi:uncharacterized protein (DUF1810 family)
VTNGEFNLDRFRVAQDNGGSFQRALRELRDGRKLSHWIWWVFPQMAGLGFSETSGFFAISSLEEARAYLRHSVLGARLREATAVMMRHATLGARAVLGADDIKFRSSMTLFLRAEPGEQLFRNAIDTFFDGVPDPLTDRLLDAGE